MDISNVDKQKIISGIEEGAHGVSITDNSGIIRHCSVYEIC